MRTNSHTERRVRDRADMSQDFCLAFPGKFLYGVMIFIERVIDNVDKSHTWRINGNHKGEQYSINILLKKDDN